MVNPPIPSVDPATLLFPEPVLAALGGRFAAAEVTARQRPAGSVILIGDSLTAYNGGTSTATPAQSLTPTLLDGKGMHNWANAFLGKDLHVVGNAGIGGQTSAQIRTRFVTDALGKEAAIAAILAGTNDGATPGTKTNLLAMYQAALQAGMLVLATTIPPGTATGAAVESHRLAVNDWIRSFVRTTPGMILADVAAAWQDPSLPGFQPVSTYVAADGVHPTVAGAMAAGRVIADALRPFVPRNRVRAAAAVAPFNLFGNPAFQGSVSSVNATTWSLGAWNVAGSNLTVTAVPRTDGLPGQMLQVVVPAGGSFYISSNVSIDGTSLQVGDSVDFGIEMEHAETADTGHTFLAAVAQYNGSGFSNRAQDLYSDSGATYGPGALLPDGQVGMKTPPVALVSGTVLVQATVSVNGAGTYRFKGSYFRNLTKIAAINL